MPRPLAGRKRMCIMVYLAADEPLQLLEWNEMQPGLHASLPAPNEDRVRVQFTKGTLVYAGSYEGCGCGFQNGEYGPEHYEPEELRQGRRSLYEFSEYLRRETAACRRHRTVRLLGRRPNGSA